MMTSMYLWKKWFRPLSIIFILLIFNPLQAQPPTGYYSTATGTGATLKTQLYDIIKGHTNMGYDGLYNCYKTTDDVDNAGQIVWDMYSDIPGPTPEPYVYHFSTSSDKCGTYNSEGDCFNREHSMPASWFNDASPMYSDLFLVVPTDGYVNNRRSNYPFGEVGSASWTSRNGSKLGNCDVPGYSGMVFEPIDEYKGDFARAYFYIATRYQNVNANWYNNTPQANVALVNNNFPFFETWYLNMLASWHVNDPVSQKEIDRNNAVYAFQGNRNPFIDNPGYVYKVWGVGQPESIAEPTQLPTSFSSRSIALNWTDGGNADGYLVRISSVGFDQIVAPTDGVMYSGTSDYYITAGTETAIIGGLLPTTTYYFKLYPYNGGGLGINYKVDGPPQISVMTD